MKLKLRLDDPETRATWQSVLRAKEEVASWPAWKRGEDTEPKRSTVKLNYYAIITREGRLKRGSGGYAIFSQYARACFWAKDDGDSVVPFEISLEEAPLFIRKE